MTTVNLTEIEKIVKRNTFYVLHYEGQYVQDYTSKIFYTDDIKKAMKFVTVFDARYHENKLPTANEHTIKKVAPAKQVLSEQQISNWTYLTGKELPFDYHQLGDLEVWVATKLNLSENWLEWCKLYDNFGLASPLIVAVVLVDNGVTDFLTARNLPDIVRANAHNYKNYRDE